MANVGGFFSSLRVRFILSVALIEIAMLAALLSSNLATLRDTHSERLEENSRNLIHLFADTTGQYLVAIDYAALEQYAQKILKQKELSYVLVIDEEGRRVAHAGNVVGGLPVSDKDVASVDDDVFDISEPIVMAGKSRGEVLMGFSLERMRETLEWERGRSILIAGSGLLLSIAVAFAVGFGLTRRLGDLVRGIEGVMHGRFTKLALGGPEEVRRLTAGYNSMLENIRMRIRDVELSEERFRSLVENSPDCVLMLDLDFRVAHLSQAGLSMFVLASSDEAKGRVFAELFPPASREWIQKGLRGAREGNVMSSTLLAYSQSTDEKWLEVVLAPVRNSDRAIVSIIGNLRDVTQTRAQAAQLEHMALHDSLTDLPNRALFMNQLDHAVEAMQRGDSTIAVLVMDLDRFKEVNDTLGHNIGDQLLQQVAFRLRQALGQHDVMARLGGDEFAVFLPKASEQEAVQAAQKIIKALELPIPLAELDIPIATSVGITMFPSHGRSAMVLLQRADVAMYYAKRQRSGFAIYSQQIDPNSLRRLTMVGELRHAIDNDELLLHFQPKINVQTRTCCGVEVLVRWRHPQHGMMPPMEFVPLAEETGLIRPMTRWVLDSALHHWSIWNRKGHRISVAVNLSVRNLMDPKLEELVATQLKRWNVPAECLQLEITESDLMSDPERAIKVLSALDEMGIRLSIDDFGTGYSSLAYLKRLPVDELKIDKSFVMGMENDDNDAMIVDATIDLAHRLGLKVVAEGVENERVLGMLAKLNCDVAQGYFISRPVEQGALVNWLVAEQARHSQAALDAPQVGK